MSQSEANELARRFYSCSLNLYAHNKDLFLKAVKETRYYCIPQELYNSELIKSLYSLSLHEKLIHQLESFSQEDEDIIYRIHLLELHNYFLYFDSYDDEFETDRELNEKFFNILRQYTHEIDETLASSTLPINVLSKYEFNLIWGIHLLNDVSRVVDFIDFLRKATSNGLNKYRALSTITYAIRKSLINNNDTETSLFFNGYSEDFLNWYLSLFNHDDINVRKHAVFETSSFSRAHPEVKERVSQALLDFIDQNVEYWTRLWAIKSLTVYFEIEQDSQGNPLSLDEEKHLFINQYMPTNITLDNITYRSAMNRDQIIDLHRQLMEVKEVFFDITQMSEVVNNDPNESLTIIIVDSKDHYKDYMPLFENLSSNNGGKYVEDLGTIYTFERTTESIFTLEEVLKHEYTHYLNGRYIIEGIYGENDTVYDQNINFFEEGIAEFFASVENGQRFVRRDTLIQNIRREVPIFMNLDRLFKSKHSDGFRYYKYAYVFFYFLYARSHMDIFHELIRSVAENDYYYEDYENNSLKDNLGINLNHLNRSYQSFIKNMIRAVRDSN